MTPDERLGVRWELLVAGLMLVFGSGALCAQTMVETPALPEAPSHRFLDKSNKIRLGILAGLVTADGVTTHNVIAHHHGTEVNPVARPLVMQGGAGQAAASVVGYTASVGTSYLFHRTGHHKLERWVLHIGMAVEAECITNNLIQSATAPGPRRRDPGSALRASATNLRSSFGAH